MGLRILLVGRCAGLMRISRPQGTAGVGSPGRRPSTALDGVGRIVSEVFNWLVMPCVGLALVVFGCQNFG